MHFAASSRVAVASFPRDGATILEISETGKLEERARLWEPGIPTILDERVYLCNEGSVTLVDLADLDQPETTRVRAAELEDDLFSEPVFWDHYMAEGDFRGSQLRIWDLEDPLKARLLIAFDLEATRVKAFAVEFPVLYVESGVSGASSSLVGIDISDPASPLVVGKSVVSGNIEDLRVVDSRAMILIGGRLNFYEISLARPSEAAYQVWQKRFFTGQTDLPLADRNADPDRDGVSNWMEFAHRRRPLNREAPPLALEFKGSKVLLSYDRRTDVASWFEYVIETLPSLVPGDWEPVPEERMVGELFGMEFYEADLPEGHRYARLRVGEK